MVGWLAFFSPNPGVHPVLGGKVACATILLDVGMLSCMCIQIQCDPPLSYIQMQCLPTTVVHTHAVLPTTVIHTIAVFPATVMHTHAVLPTTVIHALLPTTVIHTNAVLRTVSCIHKQCYPPLLHKCSVTHHSSSCTPTLGMLMGSGQCCIVLLSLIHI